MRYTIGSQTIEAPALPPALYVVATPIGNLRDITLRALETLAACQVIACEDTRTSHILLKRYGIDAPRISYNEHNAEHRADEIVARLNNGEAVALVSDAGTPLVSDPGESLVRSVIRLTLVPLPAG